MGARTVYFKDSVELDQVVVIIILGPGNAFVKIVWELRQHIVDTVCQLGQHIVNIVWELGQLQLLCRYSTGVG